MPSVNSSSRPKVWPSSTFTTPSLPTFSMASEMTSPISRSRAELARTLEAALEPQGVRAGRDVLQTLADDRLGEHRCGRGAVAGHVVGRRGDLAHELCALVLERVLDLDLTSDRDTVVRNGRSTELLVKHDITALGAERHLDGIGEDVDAALQRATSVLVELELLMSHVRLSSAEWAEGHGPGK